VAQIKDEINKSQMQLGQTIPFYTAILAVILSIAALLASIRRR